MIEDIKKIFTNLEKTIVNKIYLIFLLMFLIIFLEVTGISLVMPFLSIIENADYLTEKKNYLNFSGNLNFLNILFEPKIFFVFLIIFYIFKNFIQGFLLLIKTNFIFSIQKSLSSKLFKNYLNKSFYFHLNKNSAILIRNITDEVGSFVQNFLVSLLDLLLECLVFFSIFILLFLIEPIGASLITLLFSFVGILFYSFFKNKIQRLGQERQFHDGEKLKRLFQSFKAIKEVKILNIEKELINQFNYNNFKSLDVGSKRAFYLQLPKLIFEIFAIGSLVVLVLISMINQESSKSLIPIIGAFTAAAFRMVPSINRIVSSLQNIKFSYPSIKVIKNEIFDAKNLDKISNQLIRNKVDFKKFELKDIEFKYGKNENSVLKNINLEINKGEKIGIIGRSGAGKTTLVDIILGLLDQTKGTKLLNGINIDKSIQEWQKIISYVPQDVLLIDDTIRSNIAFGIKEEHIDDNKIHNALRNAQLSDLINNREKGIYTSLGESGLKISGGQRQRVGIARALYNLPEIIVFDEATNSLDEITEGQIFREIEQNLNEKTIIMITHRENSLKFFDKIYEIKDSMLLIKKKIINE
jgi:ABC-type multidrug transport system fused ATPase/permease subunit